eukprot:2087895-Prymnesium_polylepis.2
MNTATSVVRAWSSNKNKNVVSLSVDDFVQHVRSLGLNAADDELVAVFEQLHTGATPDQLLPEELRAGLRKLYEAAAAADREVEDEKVVCAELKQVAVRKGDETKAAALDVTVLMRQREREIEAEWAKKQAAESREGGAR